MVAGESWRLHEAEEEEDEQRMRSVVSRRYEQRTLGIISLGHAVERRPLGRNPMNAVAIARTCTIRESSPKLRSGRSGLHCRHGNIGSRTQGGRKRGARRRRIWRTGTVYLRGRHRREKWGQVWQPILNARLDGEMRRVVEKGNIARLDLRRRVAELPLGTDMKRQAFAQPFPPSMALPETTGDRVWKSTRYCVQRRRQMCATPVQFNGFALVMTLELHVERRRRRSSRAPEAAVWGGCGAASTARLALLQLVSAITAEAQEASKVDAARVSANMPSSLSLSVTSPQTSQGPRLAWREARQRHEAATPPRRLWKF